MTVTQFLGGIVLQTAYLVLLAGAVLAVVLGVMLVTDSARVLRWNASLNRWVSTREALRPLDEPRDIKRFVYRHHRVIGVLVVAGAVYSLDVLTFGFQTATLARVLRGLASQQLLGMVLDSLRLFLIVANAAALLAGLVLTFRPSLLKGAESWADRTYTPGDAKRLEEMRFEPDNWVSRHPRPAGVMALIGGAYVLLSLALPWLR